MTKATSPTMLWLFFSPSGRIGRQVFILSFLFWVALATFSLLKLGFAKDDTKTVLWFLAFMAIALGSAVSLFFLSFKRLHDMGFPGPIALMSFVPAAYIIFVIALMVWPGQTEPNDYGAETNRPR